MTKGVLQDVQQLNQNDALPVNVVARATPSPGSNASFMQQLLGNVGRFNPATRQRPADRRRRGSDRQQPVG